MTTEIITNKVLSTSTITQSTCLLSIPKTAKELSQMITTVFDARGDYPSEKEFIEEVKRLIVEYIGTKPNDYQKYIHWNEVHYTRNLIFANEDFEMMLICWGKGQASRIHDHGDSHCWAGVVEGELVERLYNYVVCEKGSIGTEKSHPTPAPCDFCPKVNLYNTNIHTIGDVGYVNDGLGVHSMGATNGVSAISIHIYSPPIRSVKILEPENNQTLTRKPGFYSVDGKKK